MEEIVINTIDDVNLSACLWDRKSSSNLLLLHMMPAVKESWEELAEEAYSTGYNVLAIDFRGHGASEGGDYKKFTDEDHQKYFIDARAALNYLEDRYLESKTVIVGASIGANIALQIISHDPLIKKVVCLSAGTDYYGVRAIDFVKELDETKHVLFVASKDDDRKSGNAVAMLDELCKACTSHCEKIVYEDGGHGTDIFKKHKDLIQQIIKFIK